MIFLSVVVCEIGRNSYFAHRQPKLICMELRERAIYETLYGNLTDISKWQNMYRNVKTNLPQGEVVIASCA